MADELKRLPRSFVNPLQAVRESAIVGRTLLLRVLRMIFFLLDLLIKIYKIRKNIWF